MTITNVKIFLLHLGPLKQIWGEFTGAVIENLAFLIVLTYFPFRQNFNVLPDHYPPGE